MHEILFGIAFAIYLLIMNILWFIICLIIWPFKREFIFDWKHCSKYLMALHANEARQRKGLPPHPMPKRKYRPKGRTVSRITFDLLEHEHEWANLTYMKYACGRMGALIGADVEFIKFKKARWAKEDSEQKFKYYPIRDHYEIRKLKYISSTKH